MELVDLVKTHIINNLNVTMKDFKIEENQIDYIRRRNYRKTEVTLHFFLLDGTDRMIHLSCPKEIKKKFFQRLTFEWVGFRYPETVIEW